MAANANEADGSILVIGVGNEFRGDDGLGVHVARELRRRSSKEVRIVEQCGEGTSLMAIWDGAAHVLIIDAVISGEPPGTVHRLDATKQQVPKRLFNSSSHSFGVAEAIEMARGLNQLPDTVVLYGIEADSFEPGVGLSGPVVRSVPDLLHLIEHDVEMIVERHVVKT